MAGSAGIGFVQVAPAPPNTPKLDAVPSDGEVAAHVTLESGLRQVTRPLQSGSRRNVFDDNSDAHGNLPLQELKMAA
jgi:hypothetical protein